MLYTYHLSSKITNNGNEQINANCCSKTGQTNEWKCMLECGPSAEQRRLQADWPIFRCLTKRTNEKSMVQYWTKQNNLVFYQLVQRYFTNITQIGNDKRYLLVMDDGRCPDFGVSGPKHRKFESKRAGCLAHCVNKIKSLPKRFIENRCCVFIWNGCIATGETGSMHTTSHESRDSETNIASFHSAGSRSSVRFEGFSNSDMSRSSALWPDRLQRSQ